MEQVKKEVDHDPKMKKAWDDFAAKKQAAEGKFQGIKTPDMGKFKNNEMLDSTLKAARAGWDKVSSATGPVISKIGQSMPAMDSLHKLTQNPVVDKLKSATGVISGKVSAISSKVGLGETTSSKPISSHERWRIVRDATVKAEERQKAKEEAAAQETRGDAENKTEETTNNQSSSDETPSDGLVVSTRGNSTWDRFGANMRDMPFLNAFFSNPLMEGLFGETEISASIRQMKEDVDPSFRLDEFVEEIETIVTPRFIKWYLEGDAGKLKAHCGEAAYAAVNASIGARLKQKVTLDTNVLSGPTEFELKAAKSSSAGESAAGSSSPLFVFTFNAQQINCLRDNEGVVVEGAVDDIRQLFYAIAIQRHPNAEKSPELEFPWMIQEIAILGNQPCW